MCTVIRAMVDASTEVTLETVLAELRSTNANVAALNERVATVIESQAVAAGHLATLHERVVALHEVSREFNVRQDAAEERLQAAMAQLQKLSEASDPTTSLPEHAAKKTRIDEKGLSKDASPATSATPTPRASQAAGGKAAPSVTFARGGHQPRPPARRSTSAPAKRQGDGPQRDEVVLLKFQAPHSDGFARAWLQDVLKSLSEELPPHEERILGFSMSTSLSSSMTRMMRTPLVASCGRHVPSSASKVARLSECLSFGTALFRSAGATLASSASSMHLMPSRAKEKLSEQCTVLAEHTRTPFTIWSSRTATSR